MRQRSLGRGGIEVSAIGLGCWGMSVMPACRELGIAFVPFSPLGRGFVTGAVTGREVIAPGDSTKPCPRSPIPASPAP